MSQFFTLSKPGVSCLTLPLASLSTLALKLAGGGHTPNQLEKAAALMEPVLRGGSVTVGALTLTRRTY